ncbi:MAG: hypothetical protein ACRDTN_15740 [Mycobacterium sp.]
MRCGARPGPVDELVGDEPVAQQQRHRLAADADLEYEVLEQRAPIGAGQG